MSGFDEEEKGRSQEMRKEQGKNRRKEARRRSHEADDGEEERREEHIDASRERQVQSIGIDRKTDPDP